MNENTEVNTKIITACGGKGVVCTVTDDFAGDDLSYTLSAGNPEFDGDAISGVLVEDPEPIIIDSLSQVGSGDYDGEEVINPKLKFGGRYRHSARAVISSALPLEVENPVSYWMKISKTELSGNEGLIDIQKKIITVLGPIEDERVLALTVVFALRIRPSHPTILNYHVFRGAYVAATYLTRVLAGNGSVLRVGLAMTRHANTLDFTDSWDVVGSSATDIFKKLYNEVSKNIKLK